MGRISITIFTILMFLIKTPIYGGSFKNGISILNMETLLYRMGALKSFNGVINKPTIKSFDLKKNSFNPLIEITDKAVLSRMKDWKNKELEAKTHFENGLKYYLLVPDSIKVNKKKGFNFIKKAAYIGYPAAQAWLAIFYNDGIGINIDKNQALLWVDRAIKNGLKKEAENDKHCGIALAKLYDQTFYKKDIKNYIYWLNRYSYDPIAKNLLGELYYYRKDEKKAVKYFIEAANGSNLKAKSWLGYIYKYSSKYFNPFKSYRWFKKGAERGDSYSIRKLGELYFLGMGVEKDYKKAFKYFQTSANSGDLNSYSWIAYLYQNGYGVDKNIKKAIENYKKAAEKGDKYSTYHLGKLLWNLKRYKEGIDWLEKGVELNSPEAITQLGEIYYYGKGGVEHDYEAAFNLFFKGSKTGDVVAISWVGYCYHYGKGVKQDIKIARFWYKLAARRYSKYATHNVGLTYYDQKNYKKAIKWFDKGVSWGYTPSFVKLGEIYFNGYGVEKDYNKAFEYFLKSGNKGDIRGISWIGYCYETGLGIEKNIEQAIKWYEKGAKKGDYYSIKRLKILKK